MQCVGLNRRAVGACLLLVSLALLPRLPRLLRTVAYLYGTITCHDVLLGTPTYYCVPLRTTMYSDQGIMVGLTHSEMSVEGRDVSLGDDSVEDVAVFFVSHRSFAQEKTEGWVR